MEARLFEEGTTPEYATADWYSGREAAPHLEEGAHRGRLELAAEHIRDAVAKFEVADVVDLGCGDGGLLSLIKGLVPAWGYDLQQSNVDASAAREVDVRYGDFIATEPEWAELAVATECLEHLVDPHVFVRRVAEHSEAIVASSPFTETAESHYAFHLWAWDMDGYAALLQQGGFEVVRHDTWSMFQVITGVRI